MSKSLDVVLNGHLANRRWSFKKLAHAAGLHPNTVYRWTTEGVAKVHQWPYLVKVADALDLNRYETNQLLASGGHPFIEVLLDRATNEEDRALLSRWARTSPNNLPAQLTSFVGREEELEQLTRLLSSARLVTLTGTGGSGKTRLALEVAQSVLDEFEGVYVVDLASVREPELVIPTISRTLDLSESLGEPPLRALETYLRDRNILLVLDNFEQVVEAAALLTELLGAARWVKALVTSRTRLNVRGEHDFAVPPLPLPSPSSGFEELTRNPSVVLFADRACVVDLGFTLTPHNASLVADVCARLDGLPLGIELAAARTRQVGLRSMLDRFSGRLALANAGPRDVPDRQRTLRATITWSYDLLGREEQRLFNCTGVFAGGFTSGAAESVGASIGQMEIEVAEGLESLVDQNLLGRILMGEDEPRYELLETIREYALERLRASGEEKATLRAHAEFYLGLAEGADLRGDGQTYWLHRLGAEYDNFRAALDWYRKEKQPETGLRLSIALMPLWQLRDRQLEARAWLDTFMAAADHVSPNLRARGVLWQGLLLMRGTGDDVSASRLFEEALVLFRNGGDLNGASETLQAKGDVYRNQGQWKLARQQYAESLELAELTGNAYLVAHGWMGLALCAQEEERFADAQRFWELTNEWAERSGDRGSIAMALNSLGEMARYRGDWKEARRYYEQALRLAKELGSEFRIALAMHNLGYVALYCGEVAQARTLFRDSLLLYKGRQYTKGEAECLAGLGKVEASEGRPERAARLCGASEAMLGEMRTRLDVLDRTDYERTLATLSSQLGGRLETLLDEGRAMSIEKAVKYAVTDHCTMS